MAEQDNDVEKNLPPSERKLEKARESGSGLKAPDLMLVISVVFVILGLSIIKGDFLKWWEKLFEINDLFTLRGGINSDGLNKILVNIMGPIYIVLLVASIVASFAAWALNGFIFSPKAISFDLSRIDPFAKFAEMFSSGGAQIWWPFLKGITSLGLLMLGVEEFVKSLMSGAGPLSSVLYGLAPCVTGFVFFAGLDLLLQIWRRSKSLGMTLQELKDEMRESEGDPMIKGKIRAIARQRARSRMMSAVATADVVIVNPEHYLVALKWDPKKGSAPFVTAKARDLMALKLKSKAIELDIPVLTAPPFARSLFAASTLDQPIPVGFYESIAIILAWAFALRDGKAASTPIVNPPVEVIKNGVNDA